MNYDMNAIVTTTSWTPIKHHLTLWLSITIWCVVLGPPLGALWYCLIASFGDPNSLLVIVFAVPFSYGYGDIPALLGGGAYSLCVSACAARMSFPWWLRLQLGMLLGGLASVLCMPIMTIDIIGHSALMYVGCGVFAGAICACCYKLTWIKRRLSLLEA